MDGCEGTEFTTLELLVGAVVNGEALADHRWAARLLLRICTFASRRATLKSTTKLHR
jgi:hypothetical protein